MSLVSRIAIRSKNFALDLLDKGAKSRESAEWLPDLWAVGGVVLAGITSYTESIAKLASITLGSASTVLPLLAVFAGVLWCIWIVGAKGITTASPVFSGDPTFEYSYRQPVRQTAKIALLTLLIILPTKLTKAIDSLVPLPSTLYGYLIDARTSQPIEGATIRVVNGEGVDVTQPGTWESDHYGFYVVKTTQRVSRDGYLSVKTSDCSELQNLSVRRADECVVCPPSRNKSDELRHVFRHVLSCKEKP